MIIYSKYLAPRTKRKINKKHLQVKYIFYRIDIEQLCIFCIKIWTKESKTSYCSFLFTDIKKCLQRYFKFLSQ